MKNSSLIKPNIKWLMVILANVLVSSTGSDNRTDTYQPPTSATNSPTGKQYDASLDRYTAISVDQNATDVVLEKERYGRRIPDNEKLEMGFLDLMLKDYDKRAWPTYGRKEPTEVMVNMYINSMGSISAADMDYTLDIYLRQSWSDTRLSLLEYGFDKPLFLNGETIATRIWKPDLFFRNVKKAEFQGPSTNTLVKISPHGEVLFSNRLTLKLSCQMSFQKYPLDKQECHVIMGSFSFTADIVRLSWMKKGITMDHNIEIPDYYLTRVAKSDPYFKSFTVIGTFSFLNATFTIQRQNGYHLVNTYLPTFLIVMISFVSFWLNVDATPARTTLGVTTLLTLTTVASSIRRQLPPVSYIKAIDIWIGICSFLVFGALLEFAMVNYLSRSKLKGLKWKDAFYILNWTKKMNPSIFPTDSLQELEIAVKEGAEQKARNLKRAKKVDCLSRIIFPSFFSII